MSSLFASRPPARGGTDWPAVVVAVALLAVIGAVLLTGTIRWSQNEVADLFTTLSPVIGVVTGAFVTYFFTRQAAASAAGSAQDSAQVALDAAQGAEARLAAAQEQLAAQAHRSRQLHNALTAAMARMDPKLSKQAEEDPIIRTALWPSAAPGDERPAGTATAGRR
jgi:hypothetical protein